MKKVYKVLLFNMITTLMALSLSKVEVFATENLENQTVESIMDEVNSDFEIVDGVLEFYSGKEADVVIPDSVTEIGDFAFEYCTTLKSVRIPDSVTKIGYRAFRNCSKLESVEIPSSVTSIEGEAFYNTKWLYNQRKIAALVIVNNVVIDGYDCKGDVEIPEGITMISDYAFWYSKLKSVKIPYGVTELGTEVFADCYNLESVEIANSVTSIGSWSFSSCSSLRKVEIPSSVTSIGDYAFFNCNNLIDIDIPSSVTTIGRSAFEDTSWKRNKIKENPFVIVNGILIKGAVMEGDVEIANSVNSIGEGAFYYFIGLHSIKIPDSVTSIREMAFFNCTNLKCIEIPDSVVEIETNTFTGCDNLVILCNRESYAESYAMSNNIKYGYIGETVVIPTKVPTSSPTEIPSTGSMDKDKQIITAKNITKTYGENSFGLGVKVIGNGKVTYSTNNSKIVVVSDKGKATIKGCGTAVITISVSETESYQAAKEEIVITVKPKKATLNSVKAGKSTTITVNWKKDKKASGYILQYTTDKKFKKNKKNIIISANKITSKKITRLKAGKKYYVRICSYKMDGGEKLFGKYSKIKSVKVKK